MRWLSLILLSSLAACTTHSKTVDPVVVRELRSTESKLDYEAGLGIRGDKTAHLENARITAFSLDPTYGYSFGNGPFKIDPDRVFREQGIMQTKLIEDAGTRSRILKALTTAKHYGAETPTCFLPGLGFRIEQESRVTDFVICLECIQVRLYWGDNGRSSDGLTKEGVAAFTSLYNELFGASPSAQKAEIHE